MRSFASVITTAALSQRLVSRRVGFAPVANIASWAREAEKSGVEFVGSYAKPKEMPRLTVPEFTLLGRSNVGKSSALNSLSYRKKKVAVVSKTPGRTRMINLFKIGKKCAITDLPGYGFAKVSRDLQDDWRKQIERYLRKRDSLKLAVLFVDSQREPQESDEASTAPSRGGVTVCARIGVTVFAPLRLIENVTGSVHRLMMFNVSAR